MKNLWTKLCNNKIKISAAESLVFGTIILALIFTMGIMFRLAEEEVESLEKEIQNLRCTNASIVYMYDVDNDGTWDTRIEEYRP